MADETSTPALQDNVLRLGFGASGAWSKSWFSETKAQALVKRALDQGISHFDTASFYAGGLAEIRLGKALLALGHKDVEVSTKTGTHYHYGKRPTKDFSETNIRKDVEQSLQRLGREQLDILYLHGPDGPQLKAAHETLIALKQEGKIKLAGVCGRLASLKHAIEPETIDIIMGPYNLLDTSCKPIFAQAKAAGMRTIGIAALIAGLGDKQLARPTSLSDIWYLLRALKHNRPVITEARTKLHQIIEHLGHKSAEHVMLAYALAETNIDTVLTNTTRLAHLDANIKTALAEPLDAALLDELNAFGVSHGFPT